MAIDLVTNRYKKIQNMGLEDMAEYFGKELKVCHKTVPTCPTNTSCAQCWKEFLQGSDN